ncbi:MAG: glycosyltransferase [Firmicutes bacterium]|nr:glycosyltransferase [Bacillota bacterium]
MPKFSIIVPVYNVEKYIEKCLDSIEKQTFKDYEVIVVNDGTLDNSMDIVKKYDFKIVNQKNKGLSAARNSGVKKASGEYIIFIDSDDYIDKDLLKKLNDSLSNNPDVVRFQIREVFEDSDKVINYKENSFNNKNGVDAFKLITGYHFVENAWCYAIRKDYYLKNKFKFAEGMIHEDYGLIPLVIIKASVVNSISYVGYNYLQRSNSIMSNKDYSKTLKKVDDFYNHYNYLISEIDKTDLDKAYFKSFISNSLIIKICELKNKDYKKYLKLLRKNKAFDNILVDTFSRRIKKILVSISPKIYYKIRND